ncbi:hypothetical protein PAXINDRAFT_155812 [Paxillus involutus ATCC 200175]|uniref:Uncharacterized protein n=1 Tax=Paxillus involutus ATCC 200175 TaxID=664439 RepID=A0A0C9SYA9_PAXIN|nr:hypothetical protein PAXINDRAFT_155812 [Paxillus involutus ATCC 200175]
MTVHLGLVSSFAPKSATPCECSNGTLGGGSSLLGKDDTLTLLASPRQTARDNQQKSCMCSFSYDVNSFSPKSATPCKCSNGTLGGGSSLLGKDDTLTGSAPRVSKINSAR